MAKPVVLTAIAEIDLEQITTYLFDHWGVSVSNNFLDRFEEICGLISSSPTIFPLIHKKKKIRKCTLTRQNIIYYREHEHKIEISTIFDTRQDPNNLNTFLTQ